MKRLLFRANLSGDDGEVPISAVILNKDGKCIGQGSNRRNKDNDPLGHAEIIALRQASLIKNDWRFNDCTLIVTLEPCSMCAGALIQSRMGQIIYGASDPKRGALGGSINLFEHKSAHHHMIVQSGVLKSEVTKQIEYWFKKMRLSKF
tara:strand:+ start:10902 stop:11345 length:444 start_codon:yes stop_codon:yes gene_type:complete